MSTDPSFKVRSATPEDGNGIALVHVKSWQAAYRGLLPDKMLDNLDASLGRRAEYWRLSAENPHYDIFVATQEKRIVAFGATSACRDEDMTPKTAELLVLYALESVWGHGVGYALYKALHAALIARQFEQVTLWVLANNNRAIRFYKRVGFRRDTTPKGIKVEQRGEVSITEWRYIMSLKS